MRNSVRILLLSLLTLAGCGTHSIVSVTVSPSATQLLDPGQSVTLTATVVSDPNNYGVTWTLNGVGALSNETLTSVVYTAPSTVTSSSTVSVTAIPVSNRLFAAATAIAVAPSPAITTTALSAGIVGTGYNVQLASTGGSSPLAWTVSSGTLPAGLSLSSSGLLSGTPTTAGSYTFSVTLTDSAITPMTSTRSYTMSVTGPAMSINAATLSNGVVGTSMSSQLALTGGIAPYTWSIASGSLPAGVTLSSSGLLSGTPTAAGSYSFTAQVKDTEPAVQTATRSFSFTVYNALVISTPSLPSGSLRNAYSATLTSTGGTSPVTWSITSGTLPSGLTLSGGVISGTPTSVGTSNITVQATDSSVPQQVVTKSLSINIVLSTLAITTTTLSQGTIGTAYSTTLQYSGGNAPVTWSLTGGSLPSGMTLTSAGVLSGTPTASGIFPITVTATDATPASVSQSLSLTVAALVPLSMTTSTLSSGNIGTAYSASLAAAGGAVPYTWTVASGSLPSGITPSSTGVLSGVPVAAGSSTFTLKVSDSASTPSTVSRAFTLSVGTSLATGANNSQLSGIYAFLLNGYNTGSTSGTVYGFAKIGSLTFNGSGTVTGIEYANGPSGTQSAVTISGSYSLGSDGRGLMVLLEGATTYVYTIAASNLSSGITQNLAIAEFDNSTGATGTANASGYAKLQTVSTFVVGSVKGNFVFGLTGESPCNSCVTPAPLFGPVVSVGVFTADGASAISAGQEDAAAYGSNYAGVTFTGSFTAPSSATGIGTITVTNVGTLFSAPPTSYIYVIVNANEMLLMSNNSHATATLLSGDAQAQKVTSYTAANLTGRLIGYESQANGGDGITAHPSALNAILSELTVTGSGAATLAQDANRAGTFASTAAGAVTYTTATNGRTAITTGGSSNQVLYLYNSSTGFALDQAASSAYPALITYVPQTAVSPYPVLLSGHYAASTATTPAATTDVTGIYSFALNSGGVDSSISGALTTALDSSTTIGNLALDNSASYLFLEDATGRLATTLSGGTTTQSVIYGINSSNAVAIPATSMTLPTVTVLQYY